MRAREDAVEAVTSQRVMGNSLTFVRAVANSIFFGLWTAFMVSYAVSTGLLLRDPDFFKRQQRHWARGLLSFWGVELEIFGAEYMSPATSYVIMANHASYADIVALFMALPIIPGFMAKRELLRVPFLAAALRAGGHVIVDRGQHDKAMKVIDTAARQVREGKTVLIFPEGTRGNSETLGDFKSGGFRLARSAGVPIIPVGLRGTGKVGPRHSLLFWPGKIEVHIGEPLLPSEIQSLDHGALMQRVRGRIVTLSGTPAS
ncbi:MAG TPA: lysophospholipid acyltransferase family protein [Polyangiales bacterium]|nr:lysophospholipid acyltransferase family protein [Polyangiales bacterium]